MSLIQKSILIILVSFVGFLVFSNVDVLAQQCGAPVCISNEKASTTSSSATITWNTNVPATSQVHWGPVLGGNCQAVNYTPINNTAVTSHSVGLSGLGSNATFCYNVISTANGYAASGSTFNFTTGSSGGPGGGTEPGGGIEPGGGTEPGGFDFRIDNPIAAESLVDLAKAIGKFIFQIAIPIAVIVIIYAGILFLTSGGNKEKIVKARIALFYAIIGLAIILIGQGFFTLIKSILNLGGPSP